MIIARKGEVYFKDIFFVNIWELALACGFDEDDHTKHTVNGVAKRDSLPPPSLQGVNISDTPLAPLRCQQTLDKRFDVCRIDVVNGLKLGELFVLFE